MELVEGVVPLGDLPAGWAGTEAERALGGQALVDVLVALHAVDPEAVGLADFGRPDGFMARQVRRWGKQWDAAQAPTRRGTDPATAAELTRLAEALAASVPTTQRHTIVHGDYRIDNCLYDAGDPGRILAVLDWELSTLGDPMADLGPAARLLVPGRRARRSGGRPSTCPARPGCPGSRAGPSRRGLRRARPGLDLAPLPWYVAFGAFKLAVVLAGILARVRAGIGAGVDGRTVWRTASTRWSRWATTSLAERAGLMRRIGSTPLAALPAAPARPGDRVVDRARRARPRHLDVGAGQRVRRPAQRPACPTPVAGPGPRARC